MTLPRIGYSLDSIEIRQELGFADLRFLVGPDPYLVKQFTNVISSVSRRTAQRWQAVGSRFVSIYDQLAQRFANVESHEQGLYKPFGEQLRWRFESFQQRSAS